MLFVQLANPLTQMLLLPIGESSISLRSTIDTQLQRYASEQLTQANAVDDAFNKRIAEISSARHAFETSLAEVQW